MSLAVQIVNYRTRAYLERCVASVVDDLRTIAVPYEINLLDNASGEDLRTGLLGGLDACRVFVADRNLGFGAGHNLLARRTQADQLLILNPDIELVGAGVVQRLLSNLERPGVAVAGPKLVGADGEVQRWDHGRLHGLRAQISYRAGHSYWRPSSSPLDVAWVSGAAMAVEHAAFRAIGGFDESFFLYKEDEDLCLRIREAGGVVVYDPTVVVRHQGSVVAPRRDELARSTSHFIEKHFPNRRRQRLFAALHDRLAQLRL